jgi:hypothetical protein
VGGGEATAPGQQSLRGGKMNILNKKKIFCPQEILHFKNKQREI